MNNPDWTWLGYTGPIRETGFLKLKLTRTIGNVNVKSYNKNCMPKSPFH